MLDQTVAFVLLIRVILLCYFDPVDGRGLTRIMRVNRSIRVIRIIRVITWPP